MHDTIQVTPTLIRRILGGGGVQLVDVAAGKPEGSERALLVFMNEEQAEAWRRETGAYPASEGFIVQATNLEGLKAIQLVWKFERIALRGPEPDAVSEFEAGEFIAMLELAEMLPPEDLTDITDHHKERARRGY